jgi:transcriptional regulator with XRE-family HTH domain
MSSKLAGLLQRFPTRALAEATKTFESKISKWKNSRALPSPEAFKAIAKAVGVSVAEISQAVAEDKAARSQAKNAAKKAKSEAVATVKAKKKLKKTNVRSHAKIAAHSS